LAFFISKICIRRILKMGNREQMMNVARKCFNYERGRIISSCAGKTCANCSNCEGGKCMKELFENGLVLID
jgi:hypothetical protein